MVFSRGETAESRYNFKDELSKPTYFEGNFLSVVGRNDFQFCEYCNRRFFPESLIKHKRYCKNQKSRKQVSQGDCIRVQDYGNLNKKFHSAFRSISNLLQIGKERRQIWKYRHEEFVSALRRARTNSFDIDSEVLEVSDKVISFKKDLVQCAFCGRWFNESSHSKHIVYCEERYEHLKRGDGVRKKNLDAFKHYEARIKYKPRIYRSASLATDKYKQTISDSSEKSISENPSPTSSVSLNGTWANSLILDEYTESNADSQGFWSYISSSSSPWDIAVQSSNCNHLIGNDTIKPDVYMKTKEEELTESPNYKNKSIENLNSWYVNKRNKNNDVQPFLFSCNSPPECSSPSVASSLSTMSFVHSSPELEKTSCQKYVKTTKSHLFHSKKNAVEIIHLPWSPSVSSFAQKCTKTSFSHFSYPQRSMNVMNNGSLSPEISHKEENNLISTRCSISENKSSSISCSKNLLLSKIQHINQPYSTSDTFSSDDIGKVARKIPIKKVFDSEIMDENHSRCKNSNSVNICLLDGVDESGQLHYQHHYCQTNYENQLQIFKNLNNDSNVINSSHLKRNSPDEQHIFCSLDNHNCYQNNCEDSFYRHNKCFPIQKADAYGNELIVPVQSNIIETIPQTKRYLITKPDLELSNNYEDENIHSNVTKNNSRCSKVSQIIFQNPGEIESVNLDSNSRSNYQQSEHHPLKQDYGEIKNYEKFGTFKSNKTDNETNILHSETLNSKMQNYVPGSPTSVMITKALLQKNKFPNYIANLEPILENQIDKKSKLYYAQVDDERDILKSIKTKISNQNDRNRHDLITNLNYCHECGQKYLIKSVKFCPNCGTKRIEFDSSLLMDQSKTNGMPDHEDLKRNKSVNSEKYTICSFQ